MTGFNLRDWLSDSLGAPEAFFGALAVCIGGIWAVVDVIYRARITNRDEDLAKLRKQLSDERALLAGREGRVAELEAQVRGRDEQISALNTAALDRDGQVIEMTAQLQKVRGELQDAQNRSLKVEFVEPEPLPKIPPATVTPAALKFMALQKALSPRRLKDSQKAGIALALAGLKARISIQAALDFGDDDEFKDDLRASFASGGWIVETSTTTTREASPEGLILGVGSIDAMSEAETRAFNALMGAGLPVQLERMGSSADVVLIITRRKP